jgi:hypothetical protein
MDAVYRIHSIPRVSRRGEVDERLGVHSPDYLWLLNAE